MRPSSDIKKPVEWATIYWHAQTWLPRDPDPRGAALEMHFCTCSWPRPSFKKVWKPLAERCVKGRKIVLLTDSAKAYTLQVDGCVHTRVVHQKKKDKHGKWLLPRYTVPQTVTLPNGKILDVVGSTQYIDGLWKHIRSGLGQCHGSNFPHINRLVRMAQWRMGLGTKDPWMGFLETLKEP